MIRIVLREAIVVDAKDRLLSRGGREPMGQPRLGTRWVGTVCADPHYRAGWPGTPTSGVGESDDTNVSLFSEGHTGNQE